MTATSQRQHANSWCAHRARYRRCAACRWPYPADTPKHLRTAQMATYSLYTVGLFVPVWVGYWISYRFGLAAKWIYVGAWTIAGIIALINPPDAPASREVPPVGGYGHPDRARTTAEVTAVTDQHDQLDPDPRPVVTFDDVRDAGGFVCAGKSRPERTKTPVYITPFLCPWCVDGQQHDGRCLHCAGSGTTADPRPGGVPGR